MVLTCLFVYSLMQLFFRMEINNCLRVQPMHNTLWTSVQNRCLYYFIGNTIIIHSKMKYYISCSKDEKKKNKCVSLSVQALFLYFTAIEIVWCSLTWCDVFKILEICSWGKSPKLINRHIPRYLNLFGRKTT